MPPQYGETTEVLPSIPGYDLLEEIGRGGMGIVYRARQRTLDRIDAVKVLARAFADDAEYIARFVHEARAAARLVHPHIVHVYAADRAGATYYLAMEYVDGPSLAQLVQKEKLLPLGRAARILAPIGRALHAAHSAGIIHRDVKPSNILLTSAEVPKLADLGLAKSPEGTTASFPGTTSAGRAAGTVSYMAPEQARDFKHVDFRADLYSLGCTLYHLLTGEVPFPADNPLAVMHLHQTATAPYLERDNERVSGEVRRLLLRLMAKKPEQRPGSALEVAEALETLAGVAAAHTPSGVASSVQPRAAVPQAKDARPRFVQLVHGFETRRDLERVTLNNPGCPVAFSLTKKGAIDDGHAMLAKFPPSSDGNPVQFHLLDFRHDWRKYETFALEVFNHETEVVPLTIQMEDREEAVAKRAEDLLPGPNHLEFAVQNLAGEVDVGSLKRVTLGVNRDAATGLSFDAIRLEGVIEEAKAVNVQPDLLIVGRQPEADCVDFAPAYLAAQTGDIIEIRSDETYELNEPLILGWHPDSRPIDRDVHIRAAPGFVPTLAAEAAYYLDPTWRMFVEGTACLEGLTLVGKPDASGRRAPGEQYGGILYGSRGSLRLFRCCFRGVRLQWGRPPSRGEGEVLVQECYVDEWMFKVQDFRYPIRVADTAFWRCYHGIQWQAQRNDQKTDPLHPRLVIRVQGCTFCDGDFMVQLSSAVEFLTDAANLPAAVAFNHTCVLKALGLCKAALPSADRVKLEPGTTLWKALKAFLVQGKDTWENVPVVPADPGGECELVLRDPDRGDLRVQPETFANLKQRLSFDRHDPIGLRFGAPDQVAYPDFLHGLAKQAREAAATGAADEKQESQPPTSPEKE